MQGPTIHVGRSRRQDEIIEESCCSEDDRRDEHESQEKSCGKSLESLL